MNLGYIILLQANEIWDRFKELHKDSTLIDLSGRWFVRNTITGLTIPAGPAEMRIGEDWKKLSRQCREYQASNRRFALTMAGLMGLFACVMMSALVVDATPGYVWPSIRLAWTILSVLR